VEEKMDWLGLSTLIVAIVVPFLTLAGKNPGLYRSLFRTPAIVTALAYFLFVGAGTAAFASSYVVSRTVKSLPESAMTPDVMAQIIAAGDSVFSFVVWPALIVLVITFLFLVGDYVADHATAFQESRHPSTPTPSEQKPSE
jgi:hypothetical protein